MEPKERAKLLYEKYNKEYIKRIITGQLQRSEHWAQVTVELQLLYRKEKELKNEKI